MGDPASQSDCRVCGNCGATARNRMVANAGATLRTDLGFAGCAFAVAQSLAHPLVCVARRSMPSTVAKRVLSVDLAVWKRIRRGFRDIATARSGTNGEDKRRVQRCDWYSDRIDAGRDDPADRADACGGKKLIRSRYPLLFFFRVTLLGSADTVSAFSNRKMT